MKYSKRWISFLLIAIMSCELTLWNGVLSLTVMGAKKRTETTGSSKKENSGKNNQKKSSSGKDSLSTAGDSGKKEDSEGTEKKDSRIEGKTVYTSMKQTENAVTASYKIDRKLQKLLDSGKYTDRNPYIVVNPYGSSPLTALVLFQTKKECSVRITVSGKKKSEDITGRISEMTKAHRVPVIGLYAGRSNQVRVDLLNKKGKTLKSVYAVIDTKKLPEKLKKAVVVKKHTRTSAYGLTVVSGFDTPYPFAFDAKGDIRWYMSGIYDTYGYFPLSNHHFILMDGEVCTQTFVKPMSQAVNEMDYMGRIYQTYMVKNGVHHEVIEKTPGGNLLVLTNSLKEHCEDCIQEIDRETGEVVKTLNMREIFGKKFMDMVDWAHLNTVSYNRENHCVIVSVRNCDAVVKLNWDTNKVVWILGDKSLYKGTKLYKYVLKAKGEYFQYQYQQHSSYEILENLDDNKNTIEIMMFDNHFVSKRPVSTFDKKKSSFVSIYSINEKKKTAEIWKTFKGVKSKVYSNYCLELEEGRVFFMGGCLEKAWKPGHRKGVIYEFDYASEKVLNTWSLKNTFYRAYELEIDWNVCAEKLSKPKNPVIGEYYTFKETVRAKSVPAMNVAGDKIHCFLTGSFLYVHSENHQISKIELAGTQKSYYFKLSAQDGGDEKFRHMEFSTVVSLENLAAGTYNIVVTENGKRKNTREIITLG